MEDSLWAGLTDSHAGLPMGMTAENLAEKVRCYSRLLRVGGVNGEILGQYDRGTKSKALMENMRCYIMFSDWSVALSVSCGD